MQWTFTKHFTVATPQRKFPMKARAPFASILKSFSSVAVGHMRLPQRCTFCHVLQLLLNWCINVVIIVNSTQMSLTLQWCSRDRKLWDRDLVKISRRDRDFIKNVETRDLKFETSKFVHFAELKKKCRRHFWRQFFPISGIFPKCFGCFLPASTTNKKFLNCRNFNKPFLCNIRSLETWNLRDQDETWNLRDRDEIWNLRDRDRVSQKWVSRRASRPKPSLETPSPWLWLELSPTTFVALSFVCAGWTKLTSEIFCSNCFLHFGYQKCFCFS